MEATRRLTHADVFLNIANRNEKNQSGYVFCMYDLLVLAQALLLCEFEKNGDNENKTNRSSFIDSQAA